MSRSVVAGFIVLGLLVVGLTVALVAIVQGGDADRDELAQLRLRTGTDQNVIDEMEVEFERLQGEVGELQLENQDLEDDLETAYDQIDQLIRQLADALAIDPDEVIEQVEDELEPVGTEIPFVLGDVPELDALTRLCAEGDMDACDQLYVESPVGTQYEDFGGTCGGRASFSRTASCAEPSVD